MWLFGVASRLASNHRRSSARRLALTARLAQEVGQAMAASSDDEVLDVRAAIRALPAKQREVVRLVHWEGFTMEQVGQILGVPASTVRGRYQTARTSLAESLSERSSHFWNAATQQPPRCPALSPYRKRQDHRSSAGPSSPGAEALTDCVRDS